MRFARPAAAASVTRQHIPAAREVYPTILECLGAQVTRIQRSNEFVPVDTEALENVQALAAQLKGADALISTDGDGDRPLLRAQLVFLVWALFVECSFLASIQ